MEQLATPVSAAPQSAERRRSGVRAWTLIPTYLGSLFAGALLKRGLGLSEYVALQLTNAVTFSALFIWWFVLTAPRPRSVRAAMGQPLGLAGCGLAMAMGLGVSCLGYIELLSSNFRELWYAASTGGTSIIRLTGADPANLVAFLFLVVVGPLVEELVFRATLFRAWRARWNPTVAVLASSVAFAVLHPQKVESFLSALAYVLLYTRTRSLWASVLAHSLGNATVAALGALHYFWPSPKLVLSGSVEHATFALALLSGAGIWLHFVIKSWRTLGAPLSPESVPATSALPTAPAELRTGSQLG